MTRRVPALLVLLAGVLQVFAYAPFYLFPLAILSPALLFYYWQTARPLRAAWLGWCYGMGLFGAGASWVYVSIHEFGNMPAPLAASMVVLFVAYLALFPALAGWFAARLFSAGSGRLLLAVPALWVISEWLRGWLLSGFPWLHLGYSQSNSVLLSLAPWLGVYGISLVVALLSALLVLAITSHAGKRLLAVTAMTLLTAMTWLAGQFSFVAPDGPLLRVAMVQGNVPLAEKWRPGGTAAVIEHYARLSRVAVPGSDLVVWPEGAVPGSWQSTAPQVQSSLPRQAYGKPAYLLGTIDMPVDGGDYYNAAVLTGEQVAIYRKQHLVPFGEYLPFAPLLGWLVDYLHIPMSNFSAWTQAQQPIRVAGCDIGVSICYEDAFGEELTASAAAAGILVNLSEDAWFGDSLAPHQRLQMAQLRAIELGRPFLRAANTGITAVIGSDGQVSASLEPFESAVLTASVQPTRGLTPYVRFGNLPILALCIAWLLLGLIAGKLMPGRES
jgi:apolipoprotein N-acyltransferase